MWISPVDKTVETVEKFEFSTVIPALSRFPQPPFSGHFSTAGPEGVSVIHVTSPEEQAVIFRIFSEKVRAPTESPPTNIPGSQEAEIKFVRNDKFSFGIIFFSLEILYSATQPHNRRYTMQGKVEICGVNTSRLKLLTQTEMDALLLRAKQGDENARQTLIEGNLRLVLSVIQRFDRRGESPDDLFQVGCIGLIKAIANFDPTKNVRFSTYGVPMIAGEVRRYLRDNSPIRVSRSIRDLAYRVMQCKEAQTTRLGREPTLEEIARELDIPIEEVSQAMDAVCAPVSLYDPVYSDGGDPLTVMDQVSDLKNTESAWMEHITLRSAFRNLDSREKEILSLRFYDGKTQMEVASRLGISQAQVSRLEKGAISAMRKSISVM